MSDDIAIRLQNVSKTFTIRDKVRGNFLEKSWAVLSGKNKRRIEAVKNISLEIKRGEFIGIVGANGSGKSTLIHLMTGVYKPDKGGISEIFGSFIRLSLGLGFNNELTARENIFLNGSVMGVKMSELKENFRKIIKFAELEKFVNTKIKYFSRGMRARLAFAVAVHAEADVILMDEFFGGVGDERFKARSDEIFAETFVKGRTIVHVSHNLSTIKKYANRVILLHEGHCLGIGTTDEIFDLYRRTIKVERLNIREE
ncbi:MAG: ATP-binding cassette domain-containing protein [Bacteroidota bacterium]|nr:ATP-binding cassette domain-containing protein [Bacteroidota bacterium]